MRMKEIKEYGLHRSGTNFLRVILQENYEVTLLTNTGGWKHGFYELPQRLGREVDVAICVKNPYAWLLSFYNHLQREQNIPFAEFVQQPLNFERPERQDRALIADGPAQLWVQMYEHWLAIELKNHRRFLFRYEDVLAEPRGSIQELVSTLQLSRRSAWPTASRDFSFPQSASEPCPKITKVNISNEANSLMPHNIRATNT